MFEYMLDKIRHAPMSETPFRHVHIDDVFEPEDFQAIVEAHEIVLGQVDSDTELFERLFENDYKIVPFPGATTDWRAYARWHAGRSNGKRPATAKPTCEAEGVVLRLQQSQTPILRSLMDFIAGPEFNRVIAGKFDIALDECTIDAGIQKYLDGYEISPHPDLRKKALTYMVNVNPHADSEKLDHHTRYLRFRPEYRYVEEFWEGNRDVERYWVPWDWCEVESQQVENNSMVIFAPSHDTLHAVRASYDHLPAQRTQVYGNLWYRDVGEGLKMEYQDIDLKGSERRSSSASAQSNPIAKWLKSLRGFAGRARQRVVTDERVDRGRKQHY